MTLKNFDVQKFAAAVCKDKRTLQMFRYLVNNSYIRVVNYHSTLPEHRQELEKEIEAFSKHFSNVTLFDINEFFITHKWNKEKPGLIPAFFEGLRCQYDVALPILDKYGFTGWFYLPSFFMDVPVSEQIEYAKQNDITVASAGCYEDGRIAMTWDEVKEISKKHEICCHTGGHFPIGKETSEDDMHREIVVAKEKLEEKIGRKIEVFCWLYGEEYNYNIRAHKFFEQAGYQYVLSNLKLEKIK